MAYLKPPWTRWFKFNWLLGMFFIFLFGISRFILVLEANKSGNFNFIIPFFILMWVAPFVFLTKTGRTAIGIRRSGNYKWIFFSFISGILMCGVVFFIGKYLYNESDNNWFLYLVKPFETLLPLIETEASTRLAWFLISALISMVFSPVGEEILYRGLIHDSFSINTGDRLASYIDSLAFAMVHLAHFGIIYRSGNFQFLPVPAAIWFILVFISSQLFFLCKKKTGSLIGAIVCHAGFNLTMVYFIFYHIL
ncbi:CPBP family intramembrane glutamic endopeptidase [Abyssalbus ytuae]|uniref:CPBP family intramembrane metalloprotease n=1 Tax=Abyssalbus ytuae TaxID=2926907 RepID=A0A9E7D0S1_9FLAO|nr:type II CAAX endopeptidase family protein [Abyssalbus ytuae]UOB16313.1 CPBP family intramembrane metalloprotease [Abyssalbus ytuae]